MAFLRLYIFVASINRKPLDLVESSCHWICSQLPMPSSSSSWAWKTILENGRCTHYVYGSRPKTLERWKALQAFSQGWSADVPSYFQPIFQESASEGEPFPKVVFAHEIHGISTRIWTVGQLLTTVVAAFMYHNMARLYILNNRPYESDPDMGDAPQMTQGELDVSSSICDHQACVTVLTLLLPARITPHS